MATRWPACAGVCRGGCRGPDPALPVPAMSAGRPEYRRRGGWPGGLVLAYAGSRGGSMVPGTRDESARAPRRGGRRALPGGVVTFVFTDIEGSTRLVKALRDRYAEVLAGLRRLVRAAIA